MLDFDRKIKGNSEKIEEFYAEKTDGVFYLSHASILVSLNNKKYLFDPVLARPPHLGSWLFYPEMEMDKRLLEVDSVFVSHQHQDHYDIEFLRMLPPNIPIYIVSGRPQFSNMLRKEGISFTELAADTIIDLGDGVNCIGINHEYNGIDAAIAISNGKFTVYHGNDCFVSNERLKIIKDVYEHIDVACIPFAYVHWYPFLLEGVDADWKKKEADRLIVEYLDYGLKQVEYLRPDVAIPFGANMFYFDDIDSEHNRAVLSPFDFKDYAESENFSLKECIMPLFSGDIVFSVENLEKRTLDIRWKQFSRKDLFDNFNGYLERVKQSGTGFDSQSIEALTYEDVSNYSFISKRLEAVGASLDHNIYISNSQRPDWGVIKINLNSRAVDRKMQVDVNEAYHHFKLTDLAYKAYFSQRFTFNEIVASSRFKLVRDPNDYNLEVLKVVNNIL